MIIKKGIKDIVSYVYQQGDLNLEYFSANRAQYGTKAHQAIQERYLEEECEVYVEGRYAIGEHEFHLNGRVDLLLEREGQWIVGEIKSTTRPLDAIIPGDRPTHLAQAKVYAYLLLCEHPEWEQVLVRLIYCDLEGVQTRQSMKCIRRKS